MKSLILLFIFVGFVYACDKALCGSLIGACGLTCTCDYPVCECCPECATCLGDMWAECCDCFGLCEAKNINVTATVTEATCMYGGVSYSYGACINSGTALLMCCNYGWKDDPPFCRIMFC